MARQSEPPIEPKVKHRCAELLGLGLSQPEAAGACKISVTSLQRFMSEPDYIKVKEDASKSAADRAEEILQSVGATVSAVLAATYVHRVEAVEAMNCKRHLLCLRLDDEVVVRSVS